MFSKEWLKMNGITCLLNMLHHKTSKCHISAVKMLHWFTVKSTDWPTRLINLYNFISDYQGLSMYKWILRGEQHVYLSIADLRFVFFKRFLHKSNAPITSMNLKTFFFVCTSLYLDTPWFMVKSAQFWQEGLCLWVIRVHLTHFLCFPMAFAAIDLKFYLYKPKCLSFDLIKTKKKDWITLKIGWNVTRSF